MLLILWTNSIIVCGSIVSMLRITIILLTERSKYMLSWEEGLPMALVNLTDLITSRRAEVLSLYSNSLTNSGKSNLKRTCVCMSLFLCDMDTTPQRDVACKKSVHVFDTTLNLTYFMTLIKF